MKRFITFLTAFLCGISALSAHNRISATASGAENTVLKYVCQTDSTTRVYGVFTLPESNADGMMLNINRKTYATDGEMNYKLLHSYNIPIADESVLAFTLLEDKGQKVNFILEFEKFPTDAPFDIIGGDGKQSFDFKGITVDAAGEKKLDDSRFLASTPCVTYGKYYEEGNCCTFYERDGVFVSEYDTYGSDHFTIHLTVMNNSDHGVLFNTEKIAATAKKPKGKGEIEVDLGLIGKASYVAEVASSDRYEAEKQASSRGLDEIGTAASFASIGLPFRSAERTGLRVLGGFLTDINHNAMRPYLNELDKTREERTRNYLQSQSLKAGESISGFFQIKRPSKIDNFKMVIRMDDYDFEFSGWIE